MVEKRKEVESRPIGKPGSRPETKRQTYILEEELIEGIQHYAEQRRISITEAVNEVIRNGLIANRYLKPSLETLASLLHRWPEKH